MGGRRTWFEVPVELLAVVDEGETEERLVGDGGEGLFVAASALWVGGWVGGWVGR